MVRYKTDYLKKIENQGNPEGYNDQELAILAEVYAKEEVKREKKHLDAYLKGRPYYTYRDKKWPVLTTDLLEDNKKEELIKQEEE